MDTPPTARRAAGDGTPPLAPIHAPLHLIDLLSREDLERAFEEAAAEGTDATQWAIAEGLVSEEVAYAAIAADLGLPFSTDPPDAWAPDALPDRAGFERRVAVRPVRDGARIAPTDDQISNLRVALAANPDLKRKLKVGTPSAARECLTRDLEPLLMDEAVNGVARRNPACSARALDVNGGWTLTVLLVLVATLLILPSGLWPTSAAIAINVVATAVFAVIVLARLAIAFATDITSRREAISRAPKAVPGPAPFYSVLVALYREGNQVADLVAALDAMDWPRSRRECVLVCEADDAETLDAISALDLPSGFRVVAVPPGEPRTKPKALEFALPTCRGDLVVIYDAEDRPDPLQMREAWAAFAADEGETGGTKLACLQAPLHITNTRGSGLLPKLFAAEYSALFDSLLPALARLGGPVPLGGTSNHFRRSALDDCGAWDAWNVTEDADLGVRLARKGYRVETIARATAEEAPASLWPWTTQRTRWFKGWMQTWLVHMRHPVRLWRELGARGFCIFHLFVTGMIVSALIHPLFIASAAWTGALILMGDWRGPELEWRRVLVGIDLSVIAFGYIAFAIAAWRTMALRGLRHLRPWLLLTPVYWVLMSVAAWRALWQLHSAPSKWEKTPHGV